MTVKRSAVKKSKAERQAEHGQAMRQPVVASIPPDDDEPSLDDLLGDDVPKIKKEKTPRQPSAPSVPRVNKGTMVSFLNKAGTRITAPGTEYYVVRDEITKKLHYKEASQVTKLPEGWVYGDPIPGEVQEPLIDSSDAVEVDSLEAGQNFLNGAQDEDDDILG